jgi:hypothetical protein
MTPLLDLLQSPLPATRDLRSRCIRIRWAAISRPGVSEEALRYIDFMIRHIERGNVELATAADEKAVKEIRMRGKL